jgi:hypothetical protein
MDQEKKVKLAFSNKVKIDLKTHDKRRSAVSDVDS